jgi:hypothetical protein
MNMKAINLLTGKVSDISEEEIDDIEILRDQFLKDAELLMAEKEIVRTILEQHLIISDADKERSRD